MSVLRWCWSLGSSEQCPHLWEEDEGMALRSQIKGSAAMFRRGLLALDRETSFSWLPRIELPSFASMSFHSLVCSSLVDTCTEVTVEDVLPRHDPSDG
ncbi:hypothetical protein BHE74_00045156 [Ensete ventricosum]|nr:hypothetical protein BHE74_00045156 [Ensete ventricosum]